MLSAMPKKLFDGRAQTAARPNSSESPAKFSEAVHKNGSIEGAAKRTTDECRRGFCQRADRLIHRRNFGDRNAKV
jgi:hypothetical protein